MYSNNDGLSVTSGIARTFSLVGHTPSLHIPPYHPEVSSSQHPSFGMLPQIFFLFRILYLTRAILWVFFII